MIVQGFVVAVLVVACATYAAWTLMPAAARRATALTLLKLPLHAALARRLGKHAVETSGCGCDGCDRSALAKPKAGAAQPITFHRPAPRRRDQA
jgi:hypothetical protein